MALRSHKKKRPIVNLSISPLQKNFKIKIIYSRSIFVANVLTFTKYKKKASKKLKYKNNHNTSS